MTEQQPEQRFELELSPDRTVGVYADFASIWHSNDIFVLDFAAMKQAPMTEEDPDTGRSFVNVPAQIVARVRIPPSQVFEFIKALEQQLTAWENEQKKKP